MSKKCSKCGEYKPTSEFHKSKNYSDGIRRDCKECSREYDLKRKNRPKIKVQRKVCSVCGVEKDVFSFSLDNMSIDGHKASCKDCNKKRRIKNIDKYLKLERHYYKKHRDNKLKAKKRYYYKNKAILRKKHDVWLKNNRDHVNEYIRKKKEKDPLFKLDYSIRASLRSVFRRRNNTVFRKKSKTTEMLGCSIEFLFDHIKKQFLSGMCFENHGEWHMDHIVPVKIASTEKEIVLLNHWSNLQPMWKKENITKGDSLFPVSNLELKITFDKKEIKKCSYDKNKQ